MICAEADQGFTARLVAKAKAIAEARAERIALDRREEPRRWRSARLLWPWFTKGP